METVQNKPRIFQWIKGDQIGNQEIFKEEVVDNGITWLYFLSGKRVNIEFLHEFLLEVKEGEILNIVEEDRSQVKEIPLFAPVKTKSPVRQLLEKQTDLESLTLTHIFEFKIPKQSIFQILQNSFGDEFNAELTSMLKETINLKELETLLQSQIENKIKNLFK